MKKHVFLWRFLDLWVTLSPQNTWEDDTICILLFHPRCVLSGWTQPVLKPEYSAITLVYTEFAGSLLNSRQDIFETNADWTEPFSIIPNKITSWAPPQYKDGLPKYRNSQHRISQQCDGLILYNRNSYTCKTTALYWNGPLGSSQYNYVLLRYGTVLSL